MMRGASGQTGGLPSELNTAFRVLRGLLDLQDEPLMKERCIFTFDLHRIYVDSKPLLAMLESLKMTNSKFVLFGLAFVAEIALSKRDEDETDTHSLLAYL